MIKNIILAIILVAQLAVWFIVDPPWRTEKAKSDPVASKKLDDIALDQAAFIECTEPTGRTLKLAKRDGLWHVENVKGYPANQAKVEDALADLKDLSKSDFRSDKSIMHENYEVDVKKGQKVKILDKGRAPLADLVIGKPDVQSRAGTFIRKADSPDVFVAKSQKLSISFGGDPYDWIKRNMMDVDAADQQRILDLKAACYRIEIEGKQQAKDATGRLVQPPEFKNVRYAYHREDAPAGSTDGEPIWRCVEPEGKGELVIADMQMKNIVQQMLGIQVMANHEIVGPATPEHKLGDDADKELHVVARFKEGENTTVRTLTVGAEFEPAPLGNQPLGKQRFAKVSHPGDKATQAYVFTVPTSFPYFYLREPETMIKRDVKPPAPQSQPAQTQPAQSQPVKR